MYKQTPPLITAISGGVTAVTMPVAPDLKGRSKRKKSPNGTKPLGDSSF